MRGTAIPCEKRALFICLSPRHRVTASLLLNNDCYSSRESMETSVIVFDFDDVLVSTARTLVGRAPHTFHAALQRVSRAVSPSFLENSLERYGARVRRLYQQQLYSSTHAQTFPLRKGVASALEALARNYRLVLLVTRPRSHIDEVYESLYQQGVLSFFPNIRLLTPRPGNTIFDGERHLEGVGCYVTNGLTKLSPEMKPRSLYWQNPWVSHRETVTSWRKVSEALERRLSARKSQQ